MAPWALATECPQYLEGFAAVFDPFSSGALFGPALQRRGIPRVAVLRSHLMPHGYHFKPSDWDEVLYYTTPEETADQLLRRGTLKALLEGAETATVETAFTRDAVRARGVKLFGATSRRVQSRRDKVATAAVLKDLSPPQFASDNLQELLYYAQHIGYPVIAKPNRNAGGAKGALCFSPRDLVSVYCAVAPGNGQLNEMLDFDTAVIVQAPLKGRQFAFNGFRDENGRVVFSGHWLYDRTTRPGSLAVSVADRLVDPLYTPGLKLLRDRIQLALERTETVGAFHVESIGDYVIDLANRLSGGGLPLLEAAGTNIDPIELTLDGFLNGSVGNYPLLYQRRGFVAAIFISTNGNATASQRTREDLQRMKEEGTVVDFGYTYPEGMPMGPSIDGDSVVATILVHARNVAERESLIREIHGWELEGRFENR